MDCMVIMMSSEQFINPSWKLLCQQQCSVGHIKIKQPAKRNKIKMEEKKMILSVN
jgi:hypothetical protein